MRPEWVLDALSAVLLMLSCVYLYFGVKSYLDLMEEERQKRLAGRRRLALRLPKKESADELP